MSDRPDIFIMAGEPSGDLIASLLIKRLLRMDPEIRITGIGGDQMQEAGAEIRFNVVRDLAIIGFAEVVTKFPRIKRLFFDTVRYLKTHRPKVLVLIDYPGFNLRLARRAHLLGIKVVYYVIPQIWAWHQSRVKKIAKFVDLSLVVFPFEEKFLSDAGARVRYVGHPLLDVMVLTMSRDEVFERFEFDPGKKLIGLLPGSRRREVDALLPVMLEAAEKIRTRMPDTQFVLPRASTVRIEQIDRHLAAAQIDVKVVDSFRYNIRSTLDFALVASGTATLETGMLLTPMIILYKMAYPTWLIAKLLIKIPYIGLINIIAADFVVPELVQDQCTAENTAERCLKILSDPGEIERVKYQLSKVKEKLGGPGASRRVAEIVMEMIRRPGGRSIPEIPSIAREPSDRRDAAS